MAPVVIAPVPDKGMVTVGTPSLNVRIRLPLTAPATVGANRKVKVIECPTTIACGANPEAH